MRKLKRYNDLEIVWKSIWEVRKINIQKEKEFCKIFFSKIDNQKAISYFENAFEDNKENILLPPAS